MGGERRGVVAGGVGGGDLAAGRVVGGAGGVRRLVDVLAVDVQGVGDEGGAAFAVARVAALETPDLDARLDAVEDAHCECCVVVVVCSVGIYCARAWWLGKHDVMLCDLLKFDRGLKTLITTW